MKNGRIRLPAILGIWFAGSAALAQSGTAGHVNYMANLQSSFDRYTDSPNISQQQWFQSHFTTALVYTTYFDTRTSWFPNAYVYQDLYGIPVGSPLLHSHPEWFLRDPSGRLLYIPYNCAGGTCPQYAADISNPAFRSYWIGQAGAALSRGRYPGLFVDDVNMEFRVSDGWGNQVAPVDTSTGQVMSYAAWRSHVAAFVEQIRAAFPTTRIMQNMIWFAGPTGVYDADPSIQRQIATANGIYLERAVASDSNLTGGTGFWSVYSFFNFVDRLHAAGKFVDFAQDSLDRAGQQYGLASYFMISTGSDTVGDAVTTPDNWWPGYDVDLGAALGPRSYNNGVFQRNFSGGIVLLGEPGLPSRAISLGGVYTTLDGASVSSVTISGSQGIILRGNNRIVLKRRPRR